jgi:hypothetical protein
MYSALRTVKYSTYIIHSCTTPTAFYFSNPTQLSVVNPTYIAGFVPQEYVEQQHITTITTQKKTLPTMIFD